MMLFGKTIVVTGVASGIGRRTAELALQLGADVIGIDRARPDQVFGAFLSGDLGTAEGVQAILDALPGGIDALCNVAGVSGQTGVAHTLAVNFLGLRALSEGAAPKMREGGAIVNVASIAGYGWRADTARATGIARSKGFDAAALVAAYQLPEEAGYPISKEVLLVWNQLAARDPLFRDRGIRVNAVSPGPVTTPILTQFRDTLGDARVNADITRVGRAGTAGDIAPVILFLCSDAARWVNGANIPTDGGLEAAVNIETLGL